MIRLQQWLNGLAESYNVRIISCQFYFSFRTTNNFNNIDCAYLGSVFIQLVKERDDLLFIRDCYVQSAQIGVFFDHFHKIVDFRNLKVDIFGVYAFRLKLFIEKADRKRMFQWIAN